MLENLITSMPMYVCTFWSVLLLIDVARNRQTAQKVRLCRNGLRVVIVCSSLQVVTSLYMTVTICL